MFLLGILFNLILYILECVCVFQNNEKYMYKTVYNIKHNFLIIISLQRLKNK
jgi:hypothetical protein